jgi:hypothetical protein
MNTPICINKIQPFVNKWGTQLQPHPEYPITFNQPFMGKKK